MFWKALKFIPASGGDWGLTNVLYVVWCNGGTLKLGKRFGLGADKYTGLDYGSGPQLSRAFLTHLHSISFPSSHSKYLYTKWDCLGVTCIADSSLPVHHSLPTAPHFPTVGTITGA